MQGSILFLGFTLLVLPACSELPDWSKNKNGDVATEHEFSNNETEAAVNTSKFLAQIAAYSASEMKVGQLAEKRATRNSVKDFAAEMVHSQRGVNAAVKQLEQQIQINIAALPSPDNKPVPIAFNTKKRTGFDRAFMDAVITNHKKAIELLVGATGENIDLDIKILITEVLPQLQVHLVQAETIRNELP
ncbi:DUF4142 domain-containing protein [Terrimonas rubra]|uniref:DUF4142 domain-containing protein n=1 Tax=Terrimonas rubra TaxID=1035890 RepID=A0ABW6AAZ5_9BACT